MWRSNLKIFLSILMPIVVLTLFLIVTAYNSFVDFSKNQMLEKMDIIADSSLIHSIESISYMNWARLQSDLDSVFKGQETAFYFVAGKSGIIEVSSIESIIGLNLSRGLDWGKYSTMGKSRKEMADGRYFVTTVLESSLGGLLDGVFDEIVYDLDIHNVGGERIGHLVFRYDSSKMISELRSLSGLFLISSILVVAILCFSIAYTVLYFIGPFRVFMQKLSQMASSEMALVDESKVIGPFRKKISQLNGVIKELSESQEEISRLKVADAVANTTQMLAHDVRKPFSMLQGVLDLIDRSGSYEDIKAVTTQATPEINRAIKSVNGMIQDVMEVGAVENYMPEVVSPEALISEALADVFRYEMKANIAFSYRLLCRDRLNIDLLKTLRVFSNIISNGAQAMSYRGEIWVETRDRGDGFTEFTIGNSGSFIPADQVDHLFDAFFTSGKKGGTGLGLAIAKKIVVGQGGKIWCRSSKVKGTEFCFTLPSLPLASSFDGFLPTCSSDLREECTPTYSDTSQLDGTADLERRVIAEMAGRGPISILIVDDESFYLTLLRDQLGSNSMISSNIIIIEAMSGEDAISLVGHQSFDIIVIDVDMGNENIDGFEAVRELRRIGSKASICIHSNRGGPRYHKMAIDSGADTFIAKTMPREHFLGLIHEVLLSDGSSSPLMVEGKEEILTQIRHLRLLCDQMEGEEYSQALKSRLLVYTNRLEELAGTPYAERIRKAANTDPPERK